MFAASMEKDTYLSTIPPRSQRNKEKYSSQYSILDEMEINYEKLLQGESITSISPQMTYSKIDRTLNIPTSSRTSMFTKGWKPSCIPRDEPTPETEGATNQ